MIHGLAELPEGLEIKHILVLADTHLGLRGRTNPLRLRRLIGHVEENKGLLVIAGDIVDEQVSSLSDEERVALVLLVEAERVVLLYGNHDRDLQRYYREEGIVKPLYDGMLARFGKWKVLIRHGDKYDLFDKNYLGTVISTALIWLHHRLRRWAARVPSIEGLLKEFSLSFTPRRIVEAVFSGMLLEAAKRQANLAVWGHTHQPRVDEVGKVTLINLPPAAANPAVEYILEIGPEGFGWLAFDDDDELVVVESDPFKEKKKKRKRKKK